MTTEFDQLIRATMADLAEEARPVSLTESSVRLARRRRTALVAVGVAGLAALAVAVTSIAAAAIQPAPISMAQTPGSPAVPWPVDTAAASPRPVLADQPGQACRDRVIAAATGMMAALPIAGAWTPRYTSDCENIYLLLNATTPQGTVWVELRSYLFPEAHTTCTESKCRETDIGPLSWGIESGMGLYGDPPGQKASNALFGGLIRKADKRNFQIAEWTTYPKSGRVLARPHTGEQLADAALAAGRAF